MLGTLKLPCGIAATLLAATCLGVDGVAAGRSVNVAMKASFPAPPFLLELLESAAGENATSYFPLLDRIASGHFASAMNDKELYEQFLRVLQQDGHASSPETVSSFKLAVSLRTAAPRIQAHYQYYETAVEPSVQAIDNCLDWLLLGRKRYCSAHQLHSDAANEEVAGDAQLRGLPFDRALGRGTEAILYADITKPAFGAYHKALVEMAGQGVAQYRLRYRVDQQGRESLPVSGYGVALQLKRTDYIVIDDREAGLDSAAQKTVSSEVVLDSEEEVTDLKPLSSSELSSLGVKAASFIMQSEDSLDTLVRLTQDFPKYSTSIAAHNESEEFLSEHRSNRAHVPAGMNVVWVNGVQLIDRQIDPYTLVDVLRRERKLIQGVTDLGLRSDQAVSLLGHEEVALAKADDAPRRFDWRDDIEEGQVIMWLNSIEKDKRYADWPDTIMALMQRTYPGQIPSVRKDLFHLIVPVDLSKGEDLTLVVEQLQSFIRRKLAVRFGLVPLVSTKAAEEQAKVVYYLHEKYGLNAVMAYLQLRKDSQRTSQLDLEESIKERALKADAVALPFAEVLASEQYTRQLKHVRHWVDRMGADSAGSPVFLNGVAISREQGWLQVMSMKLAGDLTQIQEGIFAGTVEETTWIPGLFLAGAVTGRNIYIFPEDEKQLTVLDVNKVYREHGEAFGTLIEASQDISRETWAALTVMADFSTDPGLRLLLAALDFRRNNPGLRLDVVNNKAANGCEISKALQTNSAKLLEIEDLEALRAMTATSDIRTTQYMCGPYDEALASFQEAAGVKAGDLVLLLNGRLIGPIAPEAVFKETDFQLLLDFEQKTRILPVYKAIEALDLTDKVSDPLAAAKVTSIVALSTISDLPEGIFESAPTLRTAVFDEWASEHTMISVGDASKASIHLVAVLNPASEQGQKWAPILSIISELEGVHLRIFLNPREKLDELPVKRFYRFVLESAPSFDDAGKARSLGATFKGLPSEALLNLAMDVPPAWLVAAKESVQDLDNVKLSSIKSDVKATYELENILIEGHSREESGSPPRGVQLLLSTEKDAHFADTIIMANLGYFQFKANPGYYNIKLKEGRSADIYTLDSVGAKGYKAVPGDEGTEVALMDFQGTTLYPRLSRRPGKETADVLEETEGGKNMLSRGIKFAEGMFGKLSKSASDEEHAEINIFSVASGHLYERMLNIMVLSVMKNTKHTVKFWFIEQFLSPSFKQSIPYLAEKYGFKYEMVTYKWPHWLRQQKEKQREIWGYKILFLDVLFPLSLDKVIFVDADQIVRTDMMDLVHLDLEGAPYGFTPMCDSRTEMEGFRFWKQGYWANYLRGRPYHISALYVVDLRRFRELAAGDRLRQQYHQLSADPNSLSNLDQDLPNHMQFHIPIHSLPQEWLWCETWCSDESQKAARTIDLCNNPQTKEPKLDRARRQVPEWSVYDDEIANLLRAKKAAANVVGDEPSSQKVVNADEQVERNPKSRRLEEEEKPAATSDGSKRDKDEL